MTKLLKLSYLFVTLILINNNIILSMDEQKVSAEALLPRSQTSGSLAISINGDPEIKEAEEKPSKFARCKDFIGTQAGRACTALKGLPGQAWETTKSLPKSIWKNKGTIGAVSLSGAIALLSNYIFPYGNALRYATELKFASDFHNSMKKLPLIVKGAIFYALSYVTANYLDDFTESQFGFRTGIWYSFWISVVMAVTYSVKKYMNKGTRTVETVEDVLDVINENPELKKAINQMIDKRVKELREEEASAAGQAPSVGELSLTESALGSLASA